MPARERSERCVARASTIAAIAARAPGIHRRAARHRHVRDPVAAALLACRDRDLPPMRETLVAARPRGTARCAPRPPVWIAAAPSSTALRTTRSIASFAAMPCTSVTASADSRSTGSNASMRTLRRACRRARASPAYSPPVAGEQRDRIARDEAQHSQRVMRDLIGQRDFAAGAASIPGTWKRGELMPACARIRPGASRAAGGSDARVDRHSMSGWRRSVTRNAGSCLREHSRASCTTSAVA